MIYNGFEIIIDDIAMSDPVEDWSHVRSPSRAKRREKRGFRQNVLIKRIPKKEIYKIDSGTFGFQSFSRGKLIMHSSMKEELLKKLEQYNYER